MKNHAVHSTLLKININRDNIREYIIEILYVKRIPFLILRDNPFLRGRQ